MITESGDLGLVPAETRMGDRLVVLFGASVPFVVRKVAAAGPGYRHVIVGSCYVHGAMDGQMVDGRPFPSERFDFM
jgi:hypothetical protein